MPTPADSSGAAATAGAVGPRRRARRGAQPVGRSWLVWGAGAGVYVLATFHRSSLGVAGPLAQARLSISAAQLAGFVMLQLAVYGAMQIPTGILVDRFGPRRMLLAATLTMGTAQVVFSFVHGYVPALAARGLLGCGDAMTYVSVLRLVAGWFPARRYAVLASFTALMGSVGSLAATVPLATALHVAGWQWTFAVAGGFTLAYAVLLTRPASAAPYREPVPRPGPPPSGQALSGQAPGRALLAEVKAAWRMPAGRLGFWIHLTTMAGPTTFAVLWGYPYLTAGLGMPAGGAASVMVELVVGGLIANLAIGQVVTRRPAVRVPLALAVVTACVLGWTTLVVWPGGRPPLLVVILVIAVLSIGGPASSVAFLLARDYNPRRRISTATGLVNVGGFAGTVVMTFLIGQVLDARRAPDGSYSLASFRIAFAGVAVLTLLAGSRLVTWWLRTRAEVLLAEARHEPVPVHLRRHRWDVVGADELHRAARPGPSR